ncbi:MAG TPA: CvpA family protein [Pyrinomonadaceae bacterium]|jgi:uncharacterized protein YkwD
MALNWIDGLLILLVALSVWGGYRRGFILSALDLLRWIGSLLAGLLFYKPVAGWLAAVTGWTDVWNQPAAFLLAAVAAGVLIRIAGNALLRKLSPDAHERRVNKLFGILPGLASGLVTAAIFSALFFALPLSDGLSQSLRASRLANDLAGYTDDLETALVPIFEEPLRQTLNRRTTIEPGSNERVELPFRVADPRPRPDLEAEMLALVNRERAAGGLPPLAADPEMTEVAHRHSADMFARGYFSHYTPENKDPFERMREARVKFRAAGENLALAPTLAMAHTGLMNSPGHRENILRPAFGRVGIGILDGGRRGLMVSQEFRD